MKLDSEAQREELLMLISLAGIQTTFGDIDEAKAMTERILAPIREAELEVPEED